jgi:hypothetical protein
MDTSQQCSEFSYNNQCSMPLGLDSTSSPEGEGSHNEWIITCLSTVCAIISLYIFYGVLKWVCYVFHRERQLRNEANHNDTSQQFGNHGLESSIIHSLPKSQFRKKNECKNTQSSKDCAICLEEIEEGQWLKHLPNCTHAFHVSCIDTWFQSQSNCPLSADQMSRTLLPTMNVMFLWTYFWKVWGGKTCSKNRHQITRSHVPQSYKTLDLDVNQLMPVNLVNPMDLRKQPLEKNHVGM